MFFAQISSFILIMVVFQAYSPARPSLTAWECLLASLALLAWMWVAFRTAAAALISRMHGRRPPADPARAAHTLIFVVHALAVIILAAMITLLDIKAYLVNIRILAHWETLLGLCAVGLYLGAASLAWWAVYPLEREVFQRGISARAYVWGQVRFAAPVVFPWLAMSLLQDLVSWAAPPLKPWLHSTVGDLVFLAFFLGLMALFFPVLVRHWWGCRPLPFGPVRRLAAQVLEKAGVTVGDILSWPIMQGRLLTAGILGVAPRLRYLLITPALMEALDENEMAAVVAHEAGHVHHRHMLGYLGFFLGFFFVAFALVEPIAWGLSWLTWWLSTTGWGLKLVSGDGKAANLASLVAALPLLACLLVYLRFVFGFFMRHFERQADFFSLKVLGDPEPLSRALERIAALSGNSRNVPSWHHFSIAQRVEALREAARKPHLVAAQSRKLKKCAAWYVVLVLAISAAGVATAEMDPSRNLRIAAAKNILVHRLKNGGHSPRMLMSLGILRFEGGQERLAYNALQAAYTLAPKDPEVQNALAWLLATARDGRVRNPARALALARRAVAASPKPHILDTLAEAYFRNGYYEKAVMTAQMAAAAAKGPRAEYFQRQLKRFKEAANRRR